MPTVQHRLECPECSRSVRCDSLAEAREAWRRHQHETDHYMTWIAPTEPPEGAVGEELWVARCPEDDLRSVFDSEEVAQQRVRKHSEETHHTDSTVDGVRWYTSRRSWIARLILFPGTAASFLLYVILPASIAGLLVYHFTTPIFGVSAFLLQLLLAVLVMYSARRSYRNEQRTWLYWP